MKKNILLVLAIVSFNAVFAQKAHPGLKGGLNFSNILYQNTDASDYKVGFHVGGVAHIHVTKKFAIQPELIYSEQGRKFTLLNNEYTTRLGYINIPVLAQYMFNNGFRLQAGPQLGFLVSAKEKYNRIIVDQKDKYNSTDISFAAGIGYLGPSGLGIDGRWVFGLSNINENSNGTKASNNVAQLGIFYMFHHTANKHRGK
ncbi:MAG: PorT family protein [Chitinophagaceae bacterium]|nr:PorT family protein [Chitinophagaceae bacterium]